ncbi:uncharacterized protein LOC127750078 [Frankliniella occidentalis]|uniref:Uncharacterized protein LOC127750078 n=1 Tax=Frankliniella occidentalis TaxID=133901 RepID=A0A9C6WZT4_FRAOC|nr:uncharacterized protein LOC127750078 [Frankliniella occidentalis]
MEEQYQLGRSFFPYVIVGDEGFTLSEKVMMPYPKDTCSNRLDRRIFNYRLSRARRCSENAFGVMGARFQIFRAPMRYDPDDARNLVMAVVCLHNYLRTHVTTLNPSHALITDNHRQFDTLD